jgi:hypothetical protein
MRSEILKYIALFIICCIFSSSSECSGKTKLRKVSVSFKLPFRKDSAFYQGEKIPISLHVTNHENTSINLQLSYLSLANIAIRGKSYLKLIDPEGNILTENGVACKYLYDSTENPQIYMPFIKAIKPGNEFATQFFISDYFDLWKTGKYSINFLLLDTQQNIMADARLNFLVGKKEEEIIDGVTLRLDTNSSINNLNRLKLHFINHSKRDLVFLKPKADSYYALNYPIYKIVIINPKGQMIPFVPFEPRAYVCCKFDTTYSVNLPSNSVGDSIYINVPNLKENGKILPGYYEVSVIYVLRRYMLGALGETLENKINWPEKVFVGAIRSNMIKIFVPDNITDM